MFLRLITIAALTAAPWAAMAQDPSQPVPVQNFNGSASTNSGAALQPSPQGQLQPADAGAGGVVVSGDQQALQTAGTQADLRQYLSGELDSSGQAQPEPIETESDLYFWGLLAITTLGGLWLWLEGRFSQA